MNNVLDISNYQRFEPTLHDKIEMHGEEDERMSSSTPSSAIPATKRVKEDMIQSTPSSLRTAGSLHNRLATVEAALRLQDATGASHLQQIEINPEAYGVAKSSRPHIKRLRLQRNRALHGAKPGGSSGTATPSAGRPVATSYVPRRTLMPRARYPTWRANLWRRR